MIRLLDEALAAGERVILLYWGDIGDSAADAPLTEGARLRDALGQEHEIIKIAKQEDVTTLLVEGGSLPYFERLFRNVRVDATMFEVLH